MFPRIFYHLLANTLTASVINFTVWFAITFFAYLETQSVLVTGIISGIFLVSTALSGFWLGGLVDRHSKKGAMIVSSIVSLLAYIVAALINFTAPPDAFSQVDNPLLWVFVLVLMTGVIAGNVRGIALPTIITMLFDEKIRDRANGLAGTANGVSFLITSVISGVLVGMAGMDYVLILAVAVTALTLLHLLPLELKEKEKTEEERHDSSKIDIRGTFKIIRNIPGLLPLILFTTFNNFLGGVYMALMDAYGLSLVRVEIWGLLWGFLSTGFIVGGLIIAKKGLGKNPLRMLFMANFTIWTISIFFTIQPWLGLLISGMFIYMCVIPIIEAAEHTILQKVVPSKRQGRVFGFAQSIEQAASPLTAFMIGPIAQFVFIPFMTTGRGVDLIGSWFGTGSDRGLALVFVITGIIGLFVTFLAFRSRFYSRLSEYYLGK